MVPGGFVGVDIFFVISGFLISSIIFRGLQRDRFSFAGFYANRIKRIFPALLLVLGLCAVFGWFSLLPDEYAQLGKHILGGAGYVENLVLRREAGYFDTSSFLKPLMHLWSLGIEEQFYLTYPLLLWAVWRLRGNMLAIIVPLVLISFSLNVWQVRSDAGSSFFLPQTRFWELWAGGALAYLDIFRPDIGRRLTGSWANLVSQFRVQEKTSSSGAVTPNILSMAGMVLIGVALLRVRESAFPGWWALMPVCGAALLIGAGPAAWINRRILSNRVAVFVGLISYPLYLWHWPILSFARIVRGEDLTRGTRIGAVGLSFLLAWATWRFVESPIRFGRKIWIKTAALARDLGDDCVRRISRSTLRAVSSADLRTFRAMWVGCNRRSLLRRIALRRSAPTRCVSAAWREKVLLMLCSSAIPMQARFMVGWPRRTRGILRF